MIAAVVSFLCLYFFIKPFIEYFYDAKGLRRFPNQNFLSGFSNIGLVYERLAPYRTANLYEAHKQHPIIRIAPSWISFRDVKAIKDIYGHSSTCLKGDMYAALQGSHANLVTVVNKRDHARKRKFLSNAFATRNLLTWEYKVADKVKRLMRQFDNYAEADGWATLDFQRWANLFTVEAISDIGMSYNLGLLEAGNDIVTVADKGESVQYPFIESLHGQNRPASILVWPTAWYSTLRKLSTLAPWFRSQFESGGHYAQIIHHMVAHRMARQGEKLDDFFHSLMEDRHGRLNLLDLGEIEAEVNVISEYFPANFDSP